MRKIFITMCASALVPFVGSAHTGHGEQNGFTLTHYFMEPEHAIYTWSILMVSVILIGYRMNRKHYQNKKA